jgi:hypothetical protein
MSPGDIARQQAKLAKIRKQHPVDRRRPTKDGKPYRRWHRIRKKPHSLDVQDKAD